MLSRMVQALLFDVQGTATDFHTPVTAAAREIIGGQRDWTDFVNRWRAAYFAATDSTYRNVSAVYRSALDAQLAADGIALSETDRDRLNAAWRRLEPWPDTVAGLTRLRAHYTLATLSNADVSAVVELSRHGGLPWHAVFTAEMAGVFKPDPATYAMAARYLGLEPPDIMMVACHKYDIRAAGALGFRTAFVARPLEYGDPALADVTYSDEFDINAADFNDLADQLGA